MVARYPYIVYCMHSVILALGYFRFWRASEYYSEGFMISIFPRSSTTAVPRRQLPIDTVFLAAMQSPLETPVAKVVSYVLFIWLTKKMDDPKATEMTRTASTKDDFLRDQPPPLQHTSTVVIRGRHYELQLDKEPSAYWMKELTHREIIPKSHMGKRALSLMKMN